MSDEVEQAEHRRLVGFSRSQASPQSDLPARDLDGMGDVGWTVRRNSEAPRAAFGSYQS
jgi:hypothetical protein